MLEKLGAVIGWIFVIAMFAYIAINWDDKATDALRVSGPILIALFMVWSALDRKIDAIGRRLK